MVVVTHLSTSFHQISPSFFHLRLRIPAASSLPKRGGDGGGGFALSIRAYIEKPNSISSFANTVIGSLPVIGLLARILSDEGGVGRDLVDFAEFRKRVGNKCAPSDSRAFYEFQQRRGKVTRVWSFSWWKQLQLLHMVMSEYCYSMWVYTVQANVFSIFWWFFFSDHVWLNCCVT